jgi:hypothetical protein
MGEAEEPGTPCRIVNYCRRPDQGLIRVAYCLWSLATFGAIRYWQYDCSRHHLGSPCSCQGLSRLVRATAADVA